MTNPLLPRSGYVYGVSKPMYHRFRFTLLLVLAAGSFLSIANSSDLVKDPAAGSNMPGKKSLYILGPDDLIVVNGVNAEDFANKPMRINAAGDVSFPLIGTVHAGGLSVPELESLLNKRLSVFVRNPQLVVSVTEYRSQPVSVLGAVNSPGIHQLEGRKSVVEMISIAGGLRPDAGGTITITRAVDRGRLPLPNSHLDPTGKYAAAEVSLRDITQGNRPDDNIVLMPNDILTIPKARTVYVIGQVKKAGVFPVNEESSITAIQALSMAEGPDRTADLKRAVVIRNSQLGGKREEIACDLTKMLSGKARDISLEPQDILYVPDSTGKRVALKALETAITTGSGMAIWGLR